jgi:arylsulfatase A-like enzyme/Flp pilus assembly protein TadD
MKKRGLGIVLAAAWALGGLPPAPSAAGTARPNLLLITIDTLRPDRLGCYGAKAVATPNIDALARRGVAFTRAFAHTPTTLPSHTNILLGTTPLRHGVHDNGFFKVPIEFPNLATHLKGQGYATAAVVGAFPLDSRFGLDRGFDLYDDDYGTGAALDFKFVERKAEAVVERALAWLKGRPGPWFLWIHCFDPHQPYEPPETFLTRYKNDPYGGEVAYVDAALGKLVSGLEETGQAQATAIVFTGDHGQSLGEHGETTHGYFAYNATLWVPLIVAAPGLAPARVDQDVCHVDIFPTVCDLLEIPPPPGLQGVSLLPAARGKKLAGRAIYFESLYPYYRRGWAPLRGFIEGDEKFIESPLPEVYDLKADFGESRNLAGRGVGRERSVLARLIKEETGAESAARPRLDAAAQRKLQSLGYVGGYQPPTRENFGPKDDLKTLLPFNRKFEEAVDLNVRGNAERSITLLRELIAERKDFDNPYLYLATVLQSRRRLEEAMAVLEKGSKDNPRSYKLAMEYGIVLAETGRNDEALGVLTRAAGMIDWDPELWNYLGVAYWNKGDLDHARTAYEKALALDPGYAVVLNNLGSVHFSLAVKDKDAAGLRRAMDFFRTALRHDPGYAPAYNGLGSAAMMAGDADEAVRCWRKALEIDPAQKFALYNLGVVYLDRGDKAKARAYLTKYKELYYRTLSAREKAALDADLEKCR